MTEVFIQSLSQNLQVVQEAFMTNIEQNSVSSLQNLASSIQTLSDYIRGEPLKVSRAVLNCSPNPESFQQIIRQLLSVQSRIVVIAVFDLVVSVSFAKSQILLLLYQNGTQVIMGVYIEKYQQDFLILAKSINSITDNHSQFISKSIIVAMMTYLYSLKDEYRQCVYRFVQILINKNHSCLNFVFKTFTEVCLQQEMIGDITQICFIISQFLQNSAYRHTFLNESNQLIKLLNIFTTPVVTQQEQEQNAELNKKKRIDDEKNQVEENKQKLGLIEKKLLICIDNIQTISTQLEELKTEIEAMKAEIQIQQKQIFIIQKQIDEKQLEINQNSDEQKGVLLKEQYQQVNSVLQEIVTEMNEHSVNIKKLTKRMISKENDLARYYATQISLNDQKTSIEGELSQFSGKEKKKGLKRNESYVQEYDQNLKNRIQKLDLYRQFAGCILKTPDGINYFANHPQGLSCFLGNLILMKPSHEFNYGIMLISDMLLLSVESRNFIRTQLSQPLLPQEIVVDSKYDSELFDTINMNVLEYDLNDDELESFGYLYLSRLKNIRYQKHINVSFAGGQIGQNVSLTFLTNTLLQLLKCGYFEAFFILVINGQLPQKLVGLWLINELLVKLGLLIPEFYSEFLIEIKHFRQVGYTKYCQNDIVKSTCKQMVLELPKDYITNIFNEGENQQRKIMEYNQSIMIQHNEKLSRQINAYQHSNIIQIMIDQLQIKTFPLQPLLWNWENIKSFVKITNQQIIIQHSSLFNHILSFVDGSIKDYCNIHYPKAQYSKQRQSLFNLNLPIGQIEDSAVEFNDIPIFNNFIEQNYDSLLKLGSCWQTVRIAQICIFMVETLNWYNDGALLIRQSLLLPQIGVILSQFSTYIEQELKIRQLNKQLMRSVFSFIGVLSQTFSGCQLLQTNNIYSSLYQILYEIKFVTFTRQIAYSVCPDPQYCVDIKLNPKICDCGQQCQMTNDELIQFRDQNRMLIQAACSSQDNTTRYLAVDHLGVLLNQRSYMISTNTTPTQSCKCLCYQCSKIHPFSGLISSNSVHWALTTLQTLMNDLQADVAVSAMIILESAATPQLIEQMVKENFSFSNWVNFGQYIHGKVMEYELNSNISGYDYASFFKKVINPQYFYRFAHDFEVKQYCSLNRFISSTIRDVYYDQYIDPNNENSADKVFLNQDFYLYGCMVLPHYTSAISSMLKIKIPTKEKVHFQSHRSNDDQDMIQTVETTGCYIRASLLHSLSKTEAGVNFLLENQDIQKYFKILDNVNDSGKITFRGLLYAFGLINMNVECYQQINIVFNYYELVAKLALLCDCQLTKQAAIIAIELMGNNPKLRYFYECYGFHFNQKELKDGIGYTVIPIRHLDVYLSTKQVPREVMTQIFNMKFEDSLSAFSAFREAKPSVFSIVGALDSQMRTQINEVLPGSGVSTIISRIGEQKQREMPPRLSVYCPVSAAFDYKEQGIIVSDFERFAEFQQNYQFTKFDAAQQECIFDLVGKQAMSQIVSHEYAGLLNVVNQAVQQASGERHNAFGWIKRREAYQDFDLAIFDAIQLAIQDNIYDQSAGLGMLKDLALQQKKNGLYISSQIYVYIALELSNQILTRDIRATLLQILSNPDGDLFALLDQLSQLENCKAKEGFM